MSRRSTDPLDEVAVAIRVVTGRAVSALAAQQFRQYLDLFLRWNRTHRMTALDSPAAVVRGLFVDSLLFFPLLPPRPLSILDIGAGAGIPGIPLRLADPQISLTLVESKQKRVSFLLTARRELNLENVVVMEGRAEGLLDQEQRLAAAFDVAVARAVGPTEALLPIALRYLKPGGLFIVSAPPSPTGQAPLEVVRVPIPGSRATRAFLRAVKES